jgi:GNAT superfamily N-acetyltransferase
MVEIRPVGDKAAFALWNAVVNEVAPQDALTADERRTIHTALPRNIQVLAYDGDEPVGAGSCMFHLSGPHPWIRNLVRADARRRGAGAAVYEAVSAWARTEGATRLDALADERDPAGIEFARHRGYEEVAREVQAVLELDGDVPDATPPPGVAVVTWAERPELSHGLYEVYGEATPDIPGDDQEVEPFDDWLRLHMRGPGDRSDATFVAVAGDEVVGYAKLSLTEAQPQTAYHDLTGVKRAWRGRGVARALKATQIAWAKRNGYARLSTANEERNAPIRRLNERFGYRPGPARIHLRGPLA